MARISSIFLFLLLYKLITKCDAEVTLVSRYCSGKSHDYALQDKVKYLLINFSSQASKINFYSDSTGEDNDKIYGLFQCREDLDLHICNDCIQDAQVTLAMNCANSTEAVIWYYECMLLYSNRSVFPSDNTAPFAWVWSRYNVSNPDQFDRIFTNTIKQLIVKATTSKSTKQFAVLEVNATLFTLAQCIPTMSRSKCKECLQIASAKMRQCCRARENAMVSLPSCQLRYEKYRFYNLEKASHVKQQKFLALAVSLPVGVGIGIVVVCCAICFRVRQRQANKNKKVDIDEIKMVESLKFNFSHIKAATNNFSDDNKLGRGGFGEVYKGKLRTGEDVAVKKLSKNSDQGILEFKNEVLLVAKLQHRNLVTLLGFCIAAKEKILVYEFLCNSSLDHFIYDPEKRATLDWKTRFKIIVGIARGLLYLHVDSRLKIIHRDLKSSNILLDEEMNPKISDFGIAKLVTLDQVESDTSRIVGTYGYMAPEYAMAGQFSEKSDVYSFGVIVLEIISGQRNSVFQQHNQHTEGLQHRAWRLWNEGRMTDFVDSLLGNDFACEEVRIAHHIGLLCLQEDATKRPTMVPIVTALNGNSITLPLPTQPHFFTAIDTATCTNYYSMEVEDRIQAKGSVPCVGVAGIRAA